MPTRLYQKHPLSEDLKQETPNRYRYPQTLAEREEHTMKTYDWRHEATPTQLSRIHLPHDIILLQFDLLQTQEEIRLSQLRHLVRDLSIHCLQYSYPRDLPPIERQDHDRANSLHKDLPPDVLINPTRVVPVMKVQKNGTGILKIGLDTFHLNVLRIIMGRNMELGFMGCYLLFLVCLVLYLLLLLR